MVRKHNPESGADVKSREKLRDFLVKARAFLERTHNAVTSERSRVGQDAKEALTVLWKDANTKLTGVTESQRIGNPKWRRDSFRDVGLFSEELLAKDALFDFVLQEGRFLSALKLLASIFGSLSKVFPVLSAVKEFIDAVLCVRDWIPGDPEIITIGKV